MAIVIVGAGHAGGAAALALARLGVAPLVLVGAEAEPPYERPSLSKQFLCDPSAEPNSLWPSLPAGVEWRAECAVQAIDRAKKKVQLADGSYLAYTHLVLATGGRARDLTLAGMSEVTRARLRVLRSVDDARAIRASVQTGQRWLVIGAGFIGLEVASTLQSKGAVVTVIEAGPRVLGRVVGPEVAAAVAALHQQHGVVIHCHTTLEALDWLADRNVFRVRYQSPNGGVTQEVDEVLVGIGMQANTELAQQAGLVIEQGGVRVDGSLRTSDADIYAIGDVAAFPADGQVVRRESWHNAQTQAETLALHLAARVGLSSETPAPYQVTPWFWSDQFAHSIQVMGRMTDAAQIVTRPVAAGFEQGFIRFALNREQQVQGLEMVLPMSLSKEGKLAQRLLEKSRDQAWSVAPDRLLHEPLKNLLKEGA